MLAVTGMTGHTGRFFLEELIKNQFPGKIRCLVRSRSRAASLQDTGLDLEIVEGTLDSEEDIRTLLRGADTVVHIANIHYSPQILRIGEECGVRRFILVHTTGIYSRFKAASREYQQIEALILPRMAQMHITIVRPTMIFGDLCDYNISKFIRFVDKLPILPAVAGGRALIQPVNARDLGKALYAVLHTDRCSGKAYDLSGERPITLRQLYQMIAGCLGKKRPVVSIPMWMCQFGALVLRCVSLGRIDILEKVQRMGEDRAYSHEAAAADFGYAPEPFETGLRREVAEYLSRKN